MQMIHMSPTQLQPQSVGIARSKAFFVLRVHEVFVISFKSVEQVLVEPRKNSVDAIDALLSKVFQSWWPIAQVSWTSVGAQLKLVQFVTNHPN